MCATNIIVQYIEGPEGVKWELGFAYFWVCLEKVILPAQKFILPAREIVKTLSKNFLKEASKVFNAV